MTLELLKTLLLYSLAFNAVLLTIWFMVFVYAHDFIYRLHSRWFQMTVPQFDALHYAGMMLYKLSIYFLNVAPLVAIWLMS
jgi:hypothetical protein